MIAHGRLQKIHSSQALCDLLRGKKHHKRRAAADHNCVNEYAECLQKSCLNRMIHICRCRRAGGGTGACLVGEQPSLHTIHQNGSKASGRNLPESKGLLENSYKHAGKRREVIDDNKHRQKKIEACHHRNNHVQNLHGNIPSKDNDRCHHAQNDCRCKRRYMKGIVQCRGYRITDDLADPAPADQAGNGK